MGSNFQQEVLRRRGLIRPQDLIQTVKKIFKVFRTVCFFSLLMILRRIVILFMMVLFENDADGLDILSQNGFERYHVGKHSHEFNSDRNSLSDLGRHSAEGKHPVFLHEMSSSAGEHTGKEDGLLDNCGFLPNNCLPCLTTTTVDSIEKRKSLVSSPPSAKKKAALRHSFKGKDGHLSPRCKAISSFLPKFFLTTYSPGMLLGC